MPAVFLATALLGFAQGLRAQISPEEILNPRAKALEKDYLSQLIAYNRAIQSLQFPFPFKLRRYVGLSPKADRVPDTRGLQFLKFHNQIILKISGDYKAAFNGRKLTRNQRAARVFEDVVAPILRILPKQIPASVRCDGVGLEVSYHVRSRTNSYDFEGAEDMVVILRKKDAFGFSRLSGKDQWQIVLNRSWVYIDQKEYGLALRGHVPFPLEALDRSEPAGSEPPPGGAPGPAPETANAAPTPAATASAGSGGKLTNLYRNMSLGTQLPGESQPSAATSSPPVAKAGPPAAQGTPQADSPPAATKAEAQKLQARYQTQLDTLAKDGAARLHFVEYAPPSFVIFQDRLYLQITVRNPHVFDPQAGSIYKRAAQSFDLFLALQLKFLLAQVPQDPDLAGLDITVLNDLASKPKPSSEATEFICPLAPLRKFVDAEITNQALINRSIVLVNGVRIALDLQQVE
jgi:hypothetical protein